MYKFKLFRIWLSKKIYNHSVTVTEDNGLFVDGTTLIMKASKTEIGNLWHEVKEDKK